MRANPDLRGEYGQVLSELHRSTSCALQSWSGPPPVFMEKRLPGRFAIFPNRKAGRSVACGPHKIKNVCAFFLCPPKKKFAFTINVLVQPNCVVPATISAARLP